MIRLGTKKDLIQIKAFDEFDGNRKREVTNKCLKVYLTDNKVVGYISVVENSCLCGHPIVSFLCVHPQYRRQGIASKLLTDIETRYSKRKLFISTKSNNPIMLDLIKKRDYVLAGSLANINDDGSDEIYFYKV